MFAKYLFHGVEGIPNVIFNLFFVQYSCIHIQRSHIFIYFDRKIWISLFFSDEYFPQKQSYNIVKNYRYWHLFQQVFTSQSSRQYFDLHGAVDPCRLHNRTSSSWLSVQPMPEILQAQGSARTLPAVSNIRSVQHHLLSRKHIIVMCL